jgi:RimJ/RimL family protein N-acetyltransferase
VLRPFTDADVPAIARACADPEVTRFIPHIPTPYSEDDARAYVQFTTELHEDGNRLPFAIEDAQTGELLGAIDVRLGDEGSIGYWTGPWARNRGVATKALSLLSQWALDEGGVRRLLLLTHPANRASQRVAEKAGFRRVGMTRDHLPFQDGTTDAVVFELLRNAA